MTKDLSYYMGLNYRIEIVEDKDEGGYALRCPELVGCITCAPTVEQGLQMLEDARRCWIIAQLEVDAHVPEPNELEDYSGQFKLRIPKSLHRTLAEQSKREGISMNQYCMYLLSNNHTDNNGRVPR